MINGLRELLKLFIDDGPLAVSLVAVVVLAKMVLVLMPDLSLASGLILFFGPMAALLASIARAV